LWVGAWRKNVSWNHAKIIAVDGRLLHTGGHNLWDRHYLRKQPVSDVSMELTGRIATDGHLFANAQWEFIEDNQTGIVGAVVDKMPDNAPTILQVRVTVSNWPEDTTDTFPPEFEKDYIPHVEKQDRDIPMISMGRYGALLRRARPSDDAFIAMIDASQHIIRLALQDLGPICLPKVPGPMPVPGCGWPKDYLEALGRAIWEREVDVEIILSNPDSQPDGLGCTEANYGNGWTCRDVSSEIIKTIETQFGTQDPDILRERVGDNLRVCYLRQKLGTKWADGMTLGYHAKHFIIDDIAFYMGSQNLYLADLAEWGVLVDDAETTKLCMQQYWNPIWADSYNEDEPDCDPDDVMDGLKIDRNPESPWFQNKATRKLMREAARRQANAPQGEQKFYENHSLRDFGHHH